MHEQYFARAMLSQIEQHARAQRATEVHSLEIRIGRHATIEPQEFAAAFETLRPGTICENARLVLVREEAPPLCALCGHALPPDGVLTCPKCEYPVHLERREALVLTRIDMGLPNP